MARKIDPRYFNNFIDAHVLDHTTGLVGKAVERILTLVKQEKITLLLPHSVRSEIAHPSTPAAVRHRAAELLYTEPVSLTRPEIDLHQKIRTIIQGNARPGKHDSDAYHVVESSKYGGYFITMDQRLIKKRGEITNLLEIAIVTPLEFVALYDEFERSKR